MEPVDVDNNRSHCGGVYYGTGTVCVHGYRPEEQERYARDLERQERANVPLDLGAVQRKCEQYWNESDLGDAEVHAALEFISQEDAKKNAVIEALMEALEFYMPSSNGPPEEEEPYYGAKRDAALALVRREPYICCKFCGELLKRDAVGRYCHAWSTRQ